MYILGLLRVRNEELILQDTLNHISHFCDGVIALDDASTDATYSILKAAPIVLEILREEQWSVENRPELETEHRLRLLLAARKYTPTWIYCLDADERMLDIMDNIRETIIYLDRYEIEGVRVKLYDAYITPSDKEPFQKGDKLLDFRKYFGPERREILMLWKNKESVTFIGSDAREPSGIERTIVTHFFCQHYGKSLSVSHWEDTCRYYMNYFPGYADKWMKRLGKSVHFASDFSMPLYTWDQLISLQADPVRI